MNRKLAIIFTLLFAMGITSVSAGFMDDLNITGTFESTYWDHNPDWDEEEDSLYDGPYTSFENTLSVNLDWREWFLETRLRNMNYDNPIHYDLESREHETDFELFKLTAGYRKDMFSVIAGDFYKSLARGIVLFVQEDKELNLDRTIRGGMFTFSSSPVDVELFGGKIRWYKFRDDRTAMLINEYKINDEVYGGRIAGHLPWGISLGANYTHMKLIDIFRGEYENEDLQMGSVDLEVTGLFNGLMDFYTEYAEMRWDSEMPFGNEREDGDALYASATAYLGAFTVLAEYKDYDYWDFRYSRPPTADRDDEVSETDDIQGPRIKVDYFLDTTNTLFYVSAGRFDNHAHPSNFGVIVRNRIDHIYAGIEQSFDRFYAHVTYGYKEYVTIEEIDRRITGDFVFNITDTNSLNLYYEYKSTGNPLAKKEEHETYLTYSLSPWFSLTGHYNYHVIEQSGTSEDTEDWWAGELVLTPIPALSVNVLFGGLPPGLICSGGQCRIVPEFDGVQASLTYRF